MIKLLLSLIDKFHHVKWTLILVLTLFNCVISYYFFIQRELISEYLIVNTIYLNDINGFNDWFGIFYYDGKPYISQMGIHGFLFSLPLFLGIKATSFYVGSLIAVVTFLFNYILVSTAVEIKKQINSLSAFFFLMVIILNPIFLLNAGNLYWLYFIYILPFYFTLKYYGKLNNTKFYLYLSLLFLLKFAVNFEYSSTVVMSCMIPIALKSKFNTLIDIKKLIKNIFLIFGSSVISFVVVILLNTVQISTKVDKPLMEINKIIQSYSAGSKNKPHFLNYENRIIEWNELYKSIFRDKYDEKNNGWRNAIKARNSYEGFNSIFKYINFNGAKSTIYSLQFLIFSFLSFLLSIYFLFRSKIEYKMFFILVISFISSISWIILMPLHFYLHSVYWAGVSDIILVFPFYTSVSILMGYVINKELFKFKSKKV